MKRLIWLGALAVAAFATDVSAQYVPAQSALLAPGATTVTSVGPVAVYPGGAPDGRFHPETWVGDGCNAASAAAHEGATGQTCVMLTTHGYTHITFGAGGLPVSITGTDENGIGHHYETTSSSVVGQFVNWWNWSGTQLITEIRYYESASPTSGAFASTMPNTPQSTDKVVDGVLFRLKGLTRGTMNLTEYKYQVDSIVATPSTTYQDTCTVWLRSAESTAVPFILGVPPFQIAPGVFTYSTAYWTHTGADQAGGNIRNEPAGRWGGAKGEPVPVKCGSFLPVPLDTSFYADVQNRFVSLSSFVANQRLVYAQFGADYDANVLSIFPAAHRKQLAGGVHALTDSRTPQEKEDDKLFVTAIAAGSTAAVATGAATITEGPAVDVGASAIGYLIGFTGVYVEDAMQNLYNLLMQGNNPFYSPSTSDNNEFDPALNPDTVSQLAALDGNNFDTTSNSSFGDGSSDPSGGVLDDGVDTSGGDTANAITRPLPATTPPAPVGSGGSTSTGKHTLTATHH